MNVFICSTFRDLSLERNSVALAIEHQGYHALGQEDCLPLYERPLELCLEDVRSSHLLLAIIGWCYGSAPAGHKKSFVHLEYEEAKAANIPQLIFLLEQHPEWGCVNKDSEPEHIVHLRESMRRENHCVSIEQSDCLLDVANDLLKRMEFLHAENNLLDLNHSRIQTRVIPTTAFPGRGDDMSCYKSS